MKLTIQSSVFGPLIHFVLPFISCQAVNVSLQLFYLIIPSGENQVVGSTQSRLLPVFTPAFHVKPPRADPPL